MADSQVESLCNTSDLQHMQWRLWSRRLAHLCVGHVELVRTERRHVGLDAAGAQGDHVQRAVQGPPLELLGRLIAVVAAGRRVERRQQRAGGQQDHALRRDGDTSIRTAAADAPRSRSMQV